MRTQKATSQKMEKLPQGFFFPRALAFLKFAVRKKKKKKKSEHQRKKS